jgi:hypothetical protein
MPCCRNVMLSLWRTNNFTANLVNEVFHHSHSESAVIFLKRLLCRPISIATQACACKDNRDDAKFGRSSARTRESGGNPQAIGVVTFAQRWTNELM